jgi:hypothetical protein
MFIQDVINKFRNWFCNSARGRSWDATLCCNVALSRPILSPWHKGLPKPSGSASPAFVKRARLSVPRRISGRAQNVGREGTARVHKVLN